MPDPIQAPARPERYEVSRAIMSASNTYPDMEVFSIDEAFLDVTRCQLYLAIQKIGRWRKNWFFKLGHCVP